MGTDRPFLRSGIGNFIRLQKGQSSQSLSIEFSIFQEMCSEMINQFKRKHVLVQRTFAGVSAKEIASLARPDLPGKSDSSLAAGRDLGGFLCETVVQGFVLRIIGQDLNVNRSSHSQWKESLGKASFLKVRIPLHTATISNWIRRSVQCLGSAFFNATKVFLRDYLRFVISSMELRQYPALLSELTILLLPLL